MTRAGAAGSEAGNTMTTAGAPGSGLTYSDGIAAARTMLALEGNAAVPGVPGRYRDAKLARVTRSQTFTKERRGETHVRETFSAVAGSGEAHLSLAYQQGAR
jgi:hypothetical protein